MARNARPSAPHAREKAARRLDLLRQPPSRAAIQDGEATGVLLKDEARRMAVNFAKLPELLGKIATEPDSSSRGQILDDRRRDVATVGMLVVTGDHNDNSRKHGDCERHGPE
jgi:hypothetical protein